MNTHTCELVFIGYQAGVKPGSGFNLYNLIKPERAGEHVAGSTVSAASMKRLGFTHAIVHDSDTIREEAL